MNDLFDADNHIYIQLANLLRSQIEHGYLQGKIPGIRQLAQQYSVNFKTANKAVSLLVQEGHLYRLRGKGTYVADGPAGKGAHALVSFLVTDIVNPYYAHLAQALQELASECNMTIVVNTTHDSVDALHKILESYKERSLDLVIVQGGVTRNEPHFEIIAQQGLPMIGMHTRIKAIDDIWSDMRAGAQLVTNHLVDQHGTQIGYISGSDKPIRLTGRFQGYRDALLSNGSQVDSQYIAEVDPTYRGGHQAVLAMVDSQSPPSALLFYNQIMAMGGMSALFSRDLKVPDDVAIASIDDSIAASQMLVPTTTVDFSVKEAARQTIQLARRRLASPGATQMYVRIPPRLIVRQSSRAKLLVESSAPDLNT